MEGPAPHSPPSPSPHSRAEMERFHRLVESIRDYAIFLLDPQGRVVSWNAGAERIKGYRAREIIGRHFSVFYPGEAAAAGIPQRHLEKAVAERRVEAEGWRLRKDGSRFWANVVITALHDPAGRHEGFAKVTRDLTEQREAEERLRRSHQDLEARVKERTADLARANEVLQAEIAERKRLETDL